MSDLCQCYRSKGRAWTDKSLDDVEAEYVFSREE